MKCTRRSLWESGTLSTTSHSWQGVSPLQVQPHPTPNSRLPRRWSPLAPHPLLRGRVGSCNVLIAEFSSCRQPNPRRALRRGKWAVPPKAPAQRTSEARAGDSWHDNDDDSCHDWCLCYTPETNSWQEMPRMCEARSHHSMVNYKGSLYVGSPT